MGIEQDWARARLCQARPGRPWVPAGINEANKKKTNEKERAR